MPCGGSSDRACGGRTCPRYRRWVVTHFALLDKLRWRAPPCPRRAPPKLTRRRRPAQLVEGPAADPRAACAPAPSPPPAAPPDCSRSRRAVTSRSTHRTNGDGSAPSAGGAPAARAGENTSSLRQSNVLNEGDPSEVSHAVAHLNSYVPRSTTPPRAHTPPARSRAMRPMSSWTAYMRGTSSGWKISSMSGRRLRWGYVRAPTQSREPTASTSASGVGVVIASISSTAGS